MNPTIVQQMFLEQDFPGLKGKNWQVECGILFNCIAFAVAETDVWYWPDQFLAVWPKDVVTDPKRIVWPNHLPKHPTIAAFKQLFAEIGFTDCIEDEVAESDTAVAIYASGHEVRHAARKEPNGPWMSKLGYLEVISHELAWLEGAKYGKVVNYMRKTS